MAYENVPEHTNDRFDVPGRFVSTDSGITYGITIVGEAQSGKTVLAKTALEVWGELFPDTEKLHFETGIGFRRIAAEVAYKKRGQDLPDEPVDSRTFANDVDSFSRGKIPVDMENILNRAYTGSFHYENKLRTTTVNSAVPYVAEDPFFRPHLNQAASRRLKNILHNPSLANLEERPSLVVLDGRNRFECNKLLSDAGVEPICTFVLTCLEEVAAARRVAKDATLDIEEETKRLQKRNTIDRGRGLGPLTLPRDFTEFTNVDELLGLPDEHTKLIRLGQTAVQDPEHTGIVFRTDKMTVEDEYYAMLGIISGVFPKYK